MPDFVKKLLDNNQKWVNEIRRTDPDYFKRLGEKHEPIVLWIGCSDARVPANQITGTSPGQVFVHRNIANMVVYSLSVYLVKNWVGTGQRDFDCVSD